MALRTLELHARNDDDDDNVLCRLAEHKVKLQLRLRAYLCMLFLFFWFLSASLYVSKRGAY